MLSFLLATLLASPHYSVRAAAFDYLDACPDATVVLPMFNHPDPEVRAKADLLAPQAVWWMRQRQFVAPFMELPFLDSHPNYMASNNWYCYVNDARERCVNYGIATGSPGYVEYRLATKLAMEDRQMLGDAWTWFAMHQRTANWLKMGRWQ